MLTSLVDQIDLIFGAGWPMVIVRPIPSARRSRRIIQSSYVQRGREHLAELGWGPALLNTRSHPAPENSDHPKRALVQAATDRFLASPLFLDFKSGKRVVEATPPGSRGCSDAVPPKTFPATFWRVATFAILRDPPMLAKFDGSKWIYYANPMIREPSGEAAKGPNPATPNKGQSKTEAAIEVVAKHREELQGERFAKDREAFVAREAGCGITIARNALKHWLQPKT
jgi:hypothetical protein